MSARAYRIAPRRQGAGRRSTRVNWERLGRFAVLAIFCLVLVSYVSPVVNFVDAWRDSRTEGRQLAELKAENEQLRRRAAVLAQPDAAERGARELGMVAEDELPFVVRGLER